MELNHVSLDLETLGNGPNAFIAQIGAVRFNMKGEIGQPFLVNLNDENQRTGVNWDTLMWWFNPEQDPLRLHYSAARKNSASDAAYSFASWYKGAEFIWSHATFDEVILRSLFKRLGINPPWHYRDVMDLRTYQRMVPREVWEGVFEDESIGPKHLAHFDAIRQAKIIQLCDAWIRNGR